MSAGPLERSVSPTAPRGAVSSSPRCTCPLYRFAQLAVLAAGEALAEAGWDGEHPYDPTRVGCVIATGTGGQATLEAQLEIMRERGARMVSPLGIPMYMPNAATAAVT